MTDSTLLQSNLLQLLAEPNIDARLGRGRHYLFQALTTRLEKTENPSSYQVMEAVWSLISQGLAYIDYSQPAPENWKLILTESGRAAAKDGAVNPDNSGEYLKHLKQSVPGANDVVFRYASEAVVTYNARCYLASAVMLGAASEAAFIDMALSFGNWLPVGSNEQKKMLESVKSKRQNYLTKFAEFRKRVKKYKNQLPNELADGMSLTMDSVLDLLRVYRNDAGHPTGKTINRDDAFINLQMFARYLQKLYGLKEHFDSTANNDSLNSNN